MRVESGPAAADRNYWLFVVVLCGGMTAWFCYDGAIGWNAKNRTEAKKQLAQIVPGKTVTDLPMNPTDQDFRNLLAGLTRDGGGNPPSTTDINRLLSALRATGKPVTLEAVKRYTGFSEPFHTRTDAGETVHYYASAYGMAILHIRNGVVEFGPDAWRTWYKTPSEVHSQFYWALIPFGFMIYSGWRAYRAASLRVAIDDDGVNYGGRLIAWDAIQSLRDYNKKGWVDLYHTAYGAPKRLRLDNQKIADFNGVVDAIVERKGFEHPIKAWQAQQAMQQNAGSGPDAPADNGASPR